MKRLWTIAIIVLIASGFVLAQPSDELTEEERVERYGSGKEEQKDKEDVGFSPLRVYKENYLITGVPKELLDIENDDVNDIKVQVSLMYDVFAPWKVGLYIGYTQTMFWDFFAESQPFSEVNFNPDIFWRFESKNNFLGDADLLIIKYLQIGFFEHKSNGKGFEFDSSGNSIDLSRGWDRSYIEAMLTFPAGLLQLDLGARYYFVTWSASDNADIEEYIGAFNGTVVVSIVNPDNRRVNYLDVGLKFGPGGGSATGFDFTQGWLELSAKGPTLFSRIRPYAQIWYGHGETLDNYSEDTFSFRAGLVLD